MCFPGNHTAKMAHVTLTQTRGTISELPHSCSKGASPTPKICLNKFFKEQPDMAETIPGYQSINIMKRFPFKPLTCVCFPSPPTTPSTSPKHSLNVSSSLNKLGCRQGRSLQSWPKPQEPECFPWGPPVSCRMYIGQDSFPRCHELANPISQDMRRSLFRQPPTQMAGISD